MRVFKGRGLQEFPIETRVLREADTVMVRVTNKTGYSLQHCWLWRGPRIVPLGSLDDGDEAEGVLTVSPDELSRGVQQVAMGAGFAHEMFKGREIPDLVAACRRGALDARDAPQRSDLAKPCHRASAGWNDH